VSGTPDLDVGLMEARVGRIADLEEQFCTDFVFLDVVILCSDLPPVKIK
jgi:hypothetical protein